MRILTDESKQPAQVGTWPQNVAVLRLRCPRKPTSSRTSSGPESRGAGPVDRLLSPQKRGPKKAMAKELPFGDAHAAIKQQDDDVSS